MLTYFLLRITGIYGVQSYMCKLTNIYVVTVPVLYTGTTCNAINRLFFKHIGNGSGIVNFLILYATDDKKEGLMVNNIAICH